MHWNERERVSEYNLAVSEYNLWVEQPISRAVVSLCLYKPKYLLTTTTVWIGDWYLVEAPLPLTLPYLFNLPELEVAAWQPSQHHCPWFH